MVAYNKASQSEALPSSCHYPELPTKTLFWFSKYAQREWENNELFMRHCVFTWNWPDDDDLLRKRLVGLMEIVVVVVAVFKDKKRKMRLWGVPQGSPFSFLTSQKSTSCVKLVFRVG